MMPQTKFFKVYNTLATTCSNFGKPTTTKTRALPVDYREYKQDKRLHKGPQGLYKYAKKYKALHGMLKHF